MKILKYLIIAMLFFMVTFHAQADDAREEYISGSFASDMAATVKSVQSGVTNFQNNFQQNTTSIAEKLFGLLAIVSISFTGIKLAISSGSLSEPMSAFIRTIIMVGFTYYLMGDGYNLMVVNGIDGLSNLLSNQALPAGSTIMDGFVNLTQSQYSVLSAIWEKNSAQGWLDIAQGFSGVFLLSIVLQVLFILFNLLAFVGFMAAIVTVGIAIAIGPIFIPFLLVERTSFLFDGWLKFMIGASFTKVIISIIVAVGLFCFQAIGTGESSALGKLLVCTGLGGMLCFMLLRAPEMTQSLMSGSTVSFARFAARAGKAIGGGVGSLAGIAKSIPIPTPKPRAAPIPTPAANASPGSQARRPNMSMNTGLAVRGGRQGVTIDQEPQQKPAGEISSNSSPQLPSSKS